MTSTTPEGFDSEATGTYVIPLGEREKPPLGPTRNHVPSLLGDGRYDVLKTFSIVSIHQKGGVLLRCDTCAEAGVGWSLDWPAHVAAPLLAHFAIQVEGHWNEVHA